MDTHTHTHTHTTHIVSHLPLDPVLPFTFSCTHKCTHIHFFVCIWTPPAFFPEGAEIKGPRDGGMGTRKKSCATLRAAWKKDTEINRLHKMAELEEQVFHFFVKRWDRHTNTKTLARTNPSTHTYRHAHTQSTRVVAKVFFLVAGGLWVVATVFWGMAGSV